ncbi:MAG: hypothetical protein FIB02_06880 [Desulfuromonas sp.]|nr:hypothetical protein [Desulfuromonas sp.]
MISDAELDKGLTTMKFIWGAMLFSLAIYLLVATQIGETVKVAMAPEVLDILRAVFYALAFIILFATRHIRRLVLAGKGNAASKPAPAFSQPLLQKYVSAMMVALALSESIGIFGFVLFLLGKNAVDLYVLIALSAAAMLIYRPQKEELLAMVQEEQMRAATGGPVG